MSLGKLPGIKGLVSGSQGKRRFKSDLSVDMISPPLCDFRHTMHVGRGGDVFGDTSFLSNHGGGGVEPGSPDSANSSKSTGFFARTFRHVRRPPEPRPRAGSRDLSPPPAISPIIKNAISLPQLNLETSNGCLQRVLFHSSVSSPDDSLYSYGLQSGFVTLPRLPRLDRQIQDDDIYKQSYADNDGSKLTRSDSFASFTLDLGPSLMSEVLSLIDNPGGLQAPNHGVAQCECEEQDEDGSVMSGESPVRNSPNPSVGSMDNRGRSCFCSQWTDQDSGSSSPKTHESHMGSHMGSPARAEPAMEAERFQRAAEVLSRHYGGVKQNEITLSPTVFRSHKEAYASSEEEEEIKV